MKVVEDYQLKNERRFSVYDELRAEIFEELEYSYQNNIDKFISDTEQSITTAKAMNDKYGSDRFEPFPIVMLMLKKDILTLHKELKQTDK